MTEVIDQILDLSHEFAKFEECYNQMLRLNEHPSIKINNDFYSFLRDNEYFIDTDHIRINGLNVRIYQGDIKKATYLWKIYSNNIGYTNENWETITMDKVGSELIFTKKSGDIGIFDFKNNQYYVIKKGIKRQNKNLKNFFRNYRIPQLVGIKKYNELITFIFYYFNGVHNIGTLVEKLIQNPKIEKFILMEGLELDLSTSIGIGRRYYNGRALEALNEVITHLDRYRYVINILIKANQVINWTVLYKVTRFDFASAEKKYKKAFEFYKLDTDFSIEHYYDIVDSYYFNDLIDVYRYSPKRLVERINFYVTFEGLSIRQVTSNLRDYAMMSVEMLAEGRKYNKYPNNLLTRHQIVLKNHSAFKKEYDEEKFANIMKSYEDLSFKDEDYIIILPENTTDVKDEGSQLRHCVGGYINLILQGKTMIVFLRKVKNPHKPYITVEIRDNKIVQANGLNNNTSYKDNVKDFIKKFAKKNKFEIKLGW